MPKTKLKNEIKNFLLPKRFVWDAETAESAETSHDSAELKDLKQAYTKLNEGILAEMFRDVKDIQEPMKDLVRDFFKTHFLGPILECKTPQDVRAKSEEFQNLMENNSWLKEKSGLTPGALNLISKKFPHVIIGRLEREWDAIDNLRGRIKESSVSSILEGANLSGMLDILRGSSGVNGKDAKKKIESVFKDLLSKLSDENRDLIRRIYLSSISGVPYQHQIDESYKSMKNESGLKDVIYRLAKMVEAEDQAAETAKKSEEEKSASDGEDSAKLYAIDKALLATSEGFDAVVAEKMLVEEAEKLGITEYHLFYAEGLPVVDNNDCCTRILGKEPATYIEINKIKLNGSMPEMLRCALIMNRMMSEVTEVKTFRAEDIKEPLPAGINVEDFLAVLTEAVKEKLRPELKGTYSVRLLDLEGNPVLEDGLYRIKYLKVGEYELYPLNYPFEMLEGIPFYELRIHLEVGSNAPELYKHLYLLHNDSGLVEKLTVEPEILSQAKSFIYAEIGTMARKIIGAEFKSEDLSEEEKPYLENALKTTLAFILGVGNAGPDPNAVDNYLDSISSFDELEERIMTIGLHSSQRRKQIDCIMKIGADSLRPDFDYEVHHKYTFEFPPLRAKFLSLVNKYILNERNDGQIDGKSIMTWQRQMIDSFHQQRAKKESKLKPEAIAEPVLTELETKDFDGVKSSSEESEKTPEEIRTEKLKVFIRSEIDDIAETILEAEFKLHEIPAGGDEKLEKENEKLKKYKDDLREPLKKILEHQLVGGIPQDTDEYDPTRSYLDGLKTVDEIEKKGAYSGFGRAGNVVSQQKGLRWVGRMWTKLMAGKPDLNPDFNHNSRTVLTRKYLMGREHSDYEMTQVGKDIAKRMNAISSDPVVAMEEKAKKSKE